jgi:hypothetical protein
MILRYLWVFLCLEADFFWKEGVTGRRSRKGLEVMSSPALSGSAFDLNRIFGFCNKVSGGGFLKQGRYF